MELDENGQITRSLHDPTGKVVPDVSEVHDEGDTLWLGSFKAKYIAKLELNNNFIEHTDMAKEYHHSTIKG